MAILANNQGALVAGAERKSQVLGPGLFETLRRQDAEQQVKALISDGPKHIFVGKELLTGKLQTWGSQPWVYQSMPSIEKAYQIDRWDSDDTLLHLTRRSGTTPP